VALIHCDECNHEISEYAKVCPNCGCPNNYDEDNLEPLNLSSITLGIAKNSELNVKSKNVKRFTWFVLVNAAIILSLSIISSGSLLGLTPFIILLGCIFPIFSLLFSKLLAKRAHRMTIIDPNHFKNKDEESLYQLVDTLSKKAGIKRTPEVGIYSSRDMNAFATGPSKNNSLVAFSTGLLMNMDEKAISAVAAHEIAHIANGDMITLSLVQSVINSIVLVITIPLSFIKWIAFFSENVSALAFWLIAIAKFIITTILLFLGNLVVKAFSRRREYEADKLAARLIDKESMIHALECLRNDNSISPKEQKAYAAFKINSPKGWFDIFSTHPSLEKRIASLMKEK
jgi:heat shock protein HtpX